MSKPAIKRAKKTPTAEEALIDASMVSPQRKVRIISLFSGAGGLEIAACRPGRVEAVASTDSNATFLSTVEKNMPTHFPGVRHGAIVADARELKGKTMRNLLGSTPDIVMGGPPCDDYTRYGKRRGFEGAKGPLIFEFLRLVEELQSPCFVFENVPNLIQQFKNVFERFLAQAQSIGFHTNWALLNACDFGAPTLRKRVFVVGWKKSLLIQPFKFPEPTYGAISEDDLFTRTGAPLKPFRLVCDVLSGLPEVNTAAATKFFNHSGRAHRPATIEQFKTIPPGKKISKSFRYRAPWEGLTQSLTAGLDDSTKSYIHPHYHREMSVREYARLHLFPDTWVFSGTSDNGNKQVANSVPIPFGEAVLDAVIRWLKPSDV